MRIEIVIRTMSPSDWESVSSIYKQGIDTGFATFETNVPTYESWDSAHMKSCRLVATENKIVIGWAALSPVSSRCVYGGIGEISVYIASTSRGKGVGKRLMKALILESESEGLWTIQSGIFPDNKGSIELHKKMGFRFIGKRERVGRLHGEWKDNLLFERRSSVVGV